MRKLRKGFVVISELAYATGSILGTIAMFTGAAGLSVAGIMISSVQKMKERFNWIDEDEAN